MQNGNDSLVEIIEQEKKELLKVYGERFDKEFEILELFYNQLSMFTWIVSSGLYDKVGIDILGSSIIKSFSSLYSSFTLEKEGHFGSSRILFRYVYEYLIIGKYYAVTYDDAILRKWRQKNKTQRNDISIRKLLNTVNNINPKPLLRFWSELCDFTHATKYSQQIGYSYNEYKIEFAINQGFIVILLDMMFHFMHRQFVTYDFKSAYLLIGEMKEWDRYIVMKNRQKTLLKDLKKALGKDGKTLCYFYRRKWFKDAIA